MSILESGTGNGYKASVDQYNQLQVKSTTKTEAAFRSEKEGATHILANSDMVNITSGTSGMLYVKYTGTKHLHISRIRTCGDNTQKWRLYKNITGGTLLSNAVSGMKVNVNFGSANQLSCTVYEGVDGDTISGGMMIDHWMNATGHSDVDYDGIVILGTNDSLAFTCEVSTNVEVCLRLIVFES